MISGILEAVGSLFGGGGSSDGKGGFGSFVGPIVAAAAPAAIGAFAGGQRASESTQLTREQLALQASEAQKDRDLRMAIAQLQAAASGGGGGSAAATMSAQGGILNNIVEQLIMANRIKSEAVGSAGQLSQAPMLRRLDAPGVMR